MSTNTEYNPGDLLPHKPPMLLISSIKEVDLDTYSLIATVTISDQDIFFDKSINGVPAYVSLEYMAQTIGCIAGIIERQKGIEPKVGFVLGSRSITNHIEKFDNNKSYDIKINKLFLDNEIASFDCKILSCEDNSVCSEAIINVYLPDDINNFLKEQTNHE